MNKKARKIATWIMLFIMVGSVIATCVGMLLQK